MPRRTIFLGEAKVTLELTDGTVVTGFLEETFLDIEDYSQNIGLEEYIMMDPEAFLRGRFLKQDRVLFRVVKKDARERETAETE